MSRKKKIAIIVAAIIATFLIFTLTVLPFIVRNKAIAEIESATGRKARIESVSINPFTLTVGVKAFAIEEKRGGPFISIGLLRTSLSAASIYKLALIMDEVIIDTPSISFTRIAQNRYSFSDIIERQKASPPVPKAEKKSEFQFSINNITIKNGSLDFNDQAVSGGRKHTIRNLELYIPFISNTSYLIDKYTAPKLSAVIDGAAFNFAGKTKPLSDSMESSVYIDLKQLDLPELAAYYPQRPPVDLASGKLTIDAEVNYRVSANKKPELLVKGLVRLDNIAVNLKNGQPLIKLPSLEVTASRLDIFNKRFNFDRIAFEDPEVFVSRNANGDWMYANLMPPSASGEIKAETGSEKADSNKKEDQALVQVSTILLNNGAVHFSDAKPEGGFKGKLSQIDIEVKNFTTRPERSADYELSLLLDDEAELRAEGAFSLTPQTATASVQLSDLKIQKGWPYISQFLTSPVKGDMDLSFSADFSTDAGLKVEHAGLSVKGLSARYGDKEGFDLDSLKVRDANFRQKENSLKLSEIRLTRGKLSVSREADGSISILSLLKKPSDSGKRPAATDAETKRNRDSAEAVRSLSYQIKRLQIERINAAFTDKANSKKPHFTLKNTSLSLLDLNGPRFTPAQLRFTSTFNKSTPLKLNGRVTPSPFRYSGSVSIEKLPIRDFEPYFPSSFNFTFLNGFADTAMNMNIAMKDGKPTGSLKGAAGIRAFHAIDNVEEQDLLKWESLQFDGIQGNIEPFSLALQEVALNDAYARIIVRKDGTLNVQDLIRKEEKNKEATPESAATRPAEALPVSQDASKGKRQISIGAITIQDGTLSFKDDHLPQQFDATFYNLGGRVSGMSSEETKLADVDLRGNLENQSPLQITGQINPLKDDLFVDLKVSFHDVELPPITPYSGAYLGYTVEKGKLFLDLKYHIEKKELNADNRIFIDQFTFGERVESEKATKLPVRLGLALLQDRKGEIHLDVPVTGRTDAPKFSIWRLVFQVIKNILVKAVTSPFALLSSMFGGGEDFSTIQFGYGKSDIQPQEEKKLTDLSKALIDRPALKIELKGYVDRERDAEGYRLELLDRKLRNEKFLALSKAGIIREGENADTIHVLPEEYDKYLAAVYKKEKFPKPRNVLGLVKELPPDEMKKLIIANTVVGEHEFQELARERVVAVIDHLVKKGNVQAERIFQNNDDPFRAPEKEKTLRSRVELNAIVK